VGERSGDRGLRVGRCGFHLALSAHTRPPSILPPDIAPIVGLIWVPATFCLAWLWGSVTVVKWRLWAFARTDNWALLETKAIQDGLIWNRNTLCGRVFGRTEIWSSKDREREAELKRQHAHRAGGH